jgi:60 kDa SS-A/Ro ribonucleoprotein
VNDPLTTISTRRTPQSEPDPAVADRQKPNSAGGYAFAASDEVRIHRFLTLGTTGGTFYAGERELTKANAEVVLAAARDRGAWLADEAAKISLAGRAPKQNPAIFALAAVAGLGDQDARQVALHHLPAVCRTGTALFLFNQYVEQFRGRGPALNRAVARWYLDRPVDEVAYQAVKYRQRDGWSHRDLLRLVRPKTADPARNALFRWITTGEVHPEVPQLVRAFHAAQLGGGSPDELLRLIAEHPLSWEMLPDASRTPEAWKALIRKGMPQTALMRQLPTLTRLGVLDDSTTLGIVAHQLQEPMRLRKARVHPINILVAQKTYASGRGLRGASTWEPKRRIVDALDEAFYGAFAAIEPANKRTLIALDVSGSMTWHPVGGMPITPREASAAMALVTLATEAHADVVGFCSPSSGAWTTNEGLRHYFGTGIRELTISPRQRLDDVLRYIDRLDAGGTDVSLPFRWAQAQGRDYDTVVIFTDSETWSGDQHPHQALNEYRRKVGHDVRQVVVAMTANDVSVADPLDPHSLDVAGFDSAVPNLIADFSRGTV